MGHDRGILSDPEYEVLCQWYDYIEKHIDIGLNLIGIIFYIYFNLNIDKLFKYYIFCRFFYF